MRKALVLMGAALLAGCASLPAAETPAPQRLGFTDLTDEFAALYEAAGSTSDAEKAAYIRSGMAEHLPGFYDPERFGDDAARYEERMVEYLASYPGERAAITEVAQRFGAMFDPAIVDFERRIGPLPTDVPAHLVVSMGEFDGATRNFDGRTHLLFGADVIAKIHSGNDPRAFVQHELFHIYHGARFDDCEALYCDLWSEGLAVHVAQKLNPGASDAELLLTIPEPIRPALAVHRREAVCTTLSKLDSTDDADSAGFFAGRQRLNERLPARFGYLMGAWVAADLGRTRSLAELTELDGPELRALMEKSLRSMAECG